MGTSSSPPLKTNLSWSGFQASPGAGSRYWGAPRSVCRAMNDWLSDQPIPATPAPDDDAYDSPRFTGEGPRPRSTASGTENVAMPVESWAEKLSPMPVIVPPPDGSATAWLVTPLLSSPSGSDCACVVGAAPCTLAVKEDESDASAFSRTTLICACSAGA